MFSPALRRAAHIVLLALIVFGIACRFYNLNWDEGAHLHPDERFLTMTVPKLDWPASARDYFHTNVSPLNPFNREVDFFIYGQFPLTLTKAVAARLPGTNGAPNRDNYNDILLVGRGLSALFDSLTLLVVFLIGKRWGGALLGLFAAALLALVPLHIQQAHFFVVDTFAAFFVTATFWALCFLSPTQPPPAGEEFSPPSGRGRGRAILLAGLFFGAAAACKISALLFGPIVVLAALFSIGDWRKWRKIAGGAFAVFLLLFVAFCTFRVLNPIAFRGEGDALTLGGLLDVRPAQVRLNPTRKEVSFWASFAEQTGISRGDIDPPWNWQWFGHANYIWPLRNLALWAIGWPILLAGACGMALAARRWRHSSLVTRHSSLAALWCLMVFGYYGGQYSKFARYYLVMTPFLMLLAAWFLIAFVRRFRKPWALGVIAFVPLSTLLWCAATTGIYSRPHTRMEATRWIWANVPPGTPVAIETAWDDALPIGDARGLEQIDLDLFNHDTLEKREKLLDSLDRAEWIFSSSNHVWGIIPRVPQRWPLATEYYRALFAGELGFERVKDFTSYPQLFGMQFPDDNIEESLTYYDHPHVILWRKTPQWSRAKAAQILNEDLCKRADLRPLREWLRPK